jgi:hypothetical protein
MSYKTDKTEKEKATAEQPTLSTTKISNISTTYIPIQIVLIFDILVVDNICCWVVAFSFFALSVK